MPKGKHAPEPPLVVRQRQKLEKVRLQVNLLRSALIDLSGCLSGEDDTDFFDVWHWVMSDPEFWPYVDDVAVSNQARDRLHDLAEVVYAVGIAVEHITEVNTKPAASHARQFSAIHGGNSIYGRGSPLGRGGTAFAKDQLVELVQRAIAQSTDDTVAEVTATAVARLLGHLGVVHPGTRKLIEDLRLDVHAPNLKETLRSAMAGMPKDERADPEKVIQTMFRALGVPQSELRNLFSFRDHRLKPKKSKKQEG